MSRLGKTPNMDTRFSAILSFRDGELVTVRADADAWESAPIGSLDHSLIATLRLVEGMHEPDALEAGIEQLIRSAGGRLVGHVRSADQLIVLGYVPTPTVSGPDRVGEIVVEHDPRWSALRTLLLPTAT